MDTESNTVISKEEGRIELKLRDLSQMFNSMDPAPFHEKDLDDDAEQFVVDWAREFPSHVPITLVIHLESFPQNGAPESLMRDSVHRFFEYKAQLTRREMKHLLIQGRTSLLIGLLFLTACLAAGEVVRQYASGPGSFIAREGLTIGGWVAMWRPLQIFLYDWWPIRRRYRLYDRLSQMRVVVQSAKA